MFAEDETMDLEMVEFKKKNLKYYFTITNCLCKKTIDDIKYFMLNKLGKKTLKVFVRKY